MAKADASLRIDVADAPAPLQVMFMPLGSCSLQAATRAGSMGC
jgi:hypothetical protein